MDVRGRDKPQAHLAFFFLSSSFLASVPGAGGGAKPKDEPDAAGAGEADSVCEPREGGSGARTAEAVGTGAAGWTLFGVVADAGLWQGGRGEHGCGSEGAGLDAPVGTARGLREDSLGRPNPRQ